MMKFKKTLIIFLLSTMSVVAWAQPPQPPAPASQPPDPQGDPDAVPITGIEYLILAGSAYGIYRVRKNKKFEKE
jgi:hypothetical protein